MFINSASLEAKSRERVLPPELHGVLGRTHVATGPNSDDDALTLPNIPQGSVHGTPRMGHYMASPSLLSPERFSLQLNHCIAWFSCQRVGHEGWRSRRPRSSARPFAGSLVLAGRTRRALRLHGFGRTERSQLSSADRCGVLHFHCKATLVGLIRPNYPKT
jgi:hypothetical protein